jgi:hypothetical protein
MSEAEQETGWTDEACQYWIDRSRQEAERLQMSGSEFDAYFNPIMPDPVLKYLMTLAAEQIARAFSKDPSKAIGELASAGAIESIDVNVSPAD